MNHPITRILVFGLILIVLFAGELLGPVQAHAVKPFTDIIAHVSAWIVQLFDQRVAAQGIVIRSLTNGAAVAIQPGCNGVEAVICLSAAILAFPAPWLHKVMGLLIGSVAIQVLNIIRIITLFYLLQWDKTVFEWAHLYLWQALIILDAMIIFILWLRTLPPPADDGHA